MGTKYMALCKNEGDICWCHSINERLLLKFMLRLIPAYFQYSIIDINIRK